MWEFVLDFLVNAPKWAVISLPNTERIVRLTPDIRSVIPLDSVCIFCFTLVKADPECMRRRSGYPV
jgi:hypothetical protein